MTYFAEAVLIIRERKPCRGAEINHERCDKCTSYHLCCKEKGITHCYECDIFPCIRLKRFAKNWLKYGQNIIDNQNLLKQIGESQFSYIYNSSADDKNKITK